MNKKYIKDRFLKYDTLYRLIEDRASIFGDKPLYQYFAKDKSIISVSYKEFFNDVKALATYFILRGYNGKHIAVVSESRPEWVVVYCATIAAGAVIVPIDRDLATERMTDFISLAECEAVFCSETYADKLASLAERMTCVKHLICFDKYDAEPDCLECYYDLIHTGKDTLQRGNTAIDTIDNDPKNLAAIIFTSGTTGTSKGVMISQSNILASLIGGTSMTPYDESDVFFSVLPAHHTYETCCGILGPILCGATVVFNNSLKYFAKNIQTVRPTGMIVVPLFLDTMYRRVQSEIRNTKREKAFKFGVAASKAMRHIGIDTRSVLFAKIRAGFGGRLKYIVCGGAALEPSLITHFDEVGITVAQGYGITECAPLVSVNPPDNMKCGSVGICMDGCAVKILVDDKDGTERRAVGEEIGEICVLGPQVMIGYYKDPDATAAVFTDDGYFRTGDYGYVDKDGFIYITGRKKNIIILPNGKNIYPEEIEEYLYKSSLIRECVVCSRVTEGGDEVLTALIYPDYDLLQGLDQAQIAEKLKAEVAAINRQHPAYKQIRNIEIRHTEFEKTTTKKIIRNKI